MIDLNDYFYFVHVVEKEGFSAAARVLGIPKSRLSRHVSNLEARLDVKLIQRTSRQFKITEYGQLFYNHAKAMMDEMAMAEAAISSKKDTISGRIIMSCSVGVSQFAIQELVVKFLCENPKIELIQQVTNQPVDLVTSGIDLAIRGHTEPLPDSSVVQRYLTTVSWQLFASPEYVMELGMPDDPDELENVKSLNVGWQPSASHWVLRNEQGMEKKVVHGNVYSSDDMSSLKKVAVKGLGVVNLPSYTCREELEDGSLVHVLPDWVTGRAQLSLLSPSRHGQSPAVQMFKEYLLKNIEAYVAI
ncbi:LysR substrate-binding domain-containing protein [Curvivirga aplysinae]|uniref:LysR substrate-binding domain-containing protein n=1 Tax=Curvivirga aplysinae TaxID=2529852 RepID=UPI0012BD3012|nr:LysR substrate-binding domain-containing protein [Curvivirga aplysinae]